MNAALGMVPVTAVPCPSWCTVTQQHHLTQLGDLEGSVIHAAEFEGDGWQIRLHRMTYADGSPDFTEPPLMQVDAQVVGYLNPWQALALSEAIREAAQLVL